MFSGKTVAVLAVGLSLAGGSTLAASPKPPPAPDLFAVFQAVCLDHQGDLEGARAAALAQGLTRYQKPGDATPPAPGDEGLYVPAGDKVAWYIGLGRPRVMVQGGELTTCELQAADPGKKLFKLGMDWPGSGLKGEAMAGQKTSFFYRQTAAGRVPLPEDGNAEIEPFVRAGELRVFSVEYGPYGTNLHLTTGAPTRAPANP